MSATIIDKKSENTDWLDAVRFIATIAVITIHVVAPYLYQYGSISPIKWNFYNFIDSLSRFAVPFFIMLSGALLLKRDISLIDFLKKRFTRILIPFITWTIIYTYYHYNIDNLLEGTTFILFLLDSFLNVASYHFWYIYMLIGLYLATPVLNKWVINSDDNSIKYFLLIWFVSLLLSFFNLTFNKDFSFTVFTGYIGYLILGYYLANRNPSINSVLLVLIFIASVSATFYFTYQNPMIKGIFNGKYYQYLSINVVLASASLFMLIKKHFNGSKKLVEKIKFCNNYGFGVYLVHVLILDALQKVNINGSFINPVLGIVLTIVGCYIISLIVIRTFSRISIIGRIIN